MKPEVIICTLVKRKNINSSGDFETLRIDSARLVHTFKKSNAGVSSNQQLNIVANIEADLASDLENIPQLFELTDSEGNEFAWGDTGYKARCNSCVRQGNNTQISFERNSLTFGI